MALARRLESVQQALARKADGRWRHGVEDAFDLLQAAGRLSSADEGLESCIRHARRVRQGERSLFLRQVQQGFRLAVDRGLVGGQGVALAGQRELLGGGQHELLVNGLIEVAHKLVELVHAKQRGDQFCALGGRPGGDSGECVDPILLDEAEPEGVGIGGHGDFPVLVVGRPQGRRLKTSSVEVGEISAPVDAFGLCLFD